MATKAIYKYPLNLTLLDGSDGMDVLLPPNSRILSVQAQNGVLCLWAWLEDKDAKATITRRIHVFGTGNAIPKTPNENDVYNFLSTAQMTIGGTLGVWHVFERIRMPLTPDVTQ